MRSWIFVWVIAPILAVMLYGALIYGAYRLVRHMLAKRRESRQAEAAYQERSRAVWQRSGGDVIQSVGDDQILAINRDTQELILGTLSDPLYYHFSDLKSASIEYAEHREGYGSGYNFQSGYSTMHMSSRDVVDAIFLSVTVEDWDRPVHRICFFRGGGWIGAAKAFREAQENVERIRANLRTVIEQRVPKPAVPRLVPAKTDLVPYHTAVPVPNRFNHRIHIILACLTGGMWVPVWVILYMIRPKYSYE